MFRLQLVEEFNHWKEKRKKRSFLQYLTEDICLNHWAYTVKSLRRLEFLIRNSLTHLHFFNIKHPYKNNKTMLRCVNN